jgi:glutamate/tyrosine decarboxylase-like PLP-dependent enzyme
MQGNLKIFTSEVCHYSMYKGAILCGIGSNNLIYVKTDENRRMIPEDLEKCILEEKEKGYEALIVNTTTGTTVEGAIDPVTEIG